MSHLSLIAWNCRSGSMTSRIADVTALAPDIVFLQEILPTESLPLMGQFVSRRVGPQKGIALGSLNANYQLVELEARAGAGLGSIAAAVSGPTSFNVLGIWSQAPSYVDYVMRAIAAYADVLRSGPSVVMGDLNSGSDLTRAQPSSKGHSRIVSALAELGLVSAYHAFHHIKHGHESHATYRHQFKATQPWHIDFCFVPRNWVDRLTGVEVVDGEDWRTRSDHHPLRVDLAVEPRV